MLRKYRPAFSLVVILAVVEAHAAKATTYYVDYNAGSDSNSGICNPEAGSCAAGTGPWKTPPGSACIGDAITSCNAIEPTTSHTGWHAIGRGDSLLFHGGETFPLMMYVDANWYSALQSPGAGTTFGRYSTGADPQINAGDNPKNLAEPGASGGWTAVSGQANIYSAPFNCSRLVTRNTGNAADSVQVLRTNDSGNNWYRWTAGAQLVGGTNNNTMNGGTACDTSIPNGGVFQDCPNNRICMASTSAPNADTWHFSWRPYLIDIDAIKSLTISHIQFFGKAYVGAGSGETGGSVMFKQSTASTNITLDFIDVEHSGGDGVRIYSDVLNSNFTMTNSTLNDIYVYGLESASGTSGASNNTIANNVISYTGDHGLSIGGMGGVVIRANTIKFTGVGQAGCGLTTPGSHCSYKNGLSGYGCGIAFGSATSIFTTGAQVTQNQISHAGEGCRLNLAANTLCDGSGSANYCNGACDGIYILGLQGTNNLIANNFLAYNWGAGIAVNNAGAEGATGVDIINNSLFNNNGLGFEDFVGGLATGAWHFVNNIIYSSINTRLATFFWHSGTSSPTMNKNNILNGGNTAHNYWCNDTAQYTSTPCTYMTNPLSVNPSFVSTADPPNLHLNSGSPMIKQGAATALITTDIDGNIRVAPFDIGAAEFQSAVPTTSTTSIPSTTSTSNTNPTTTSSTGITTSTSSTSTTSTIPVGSLRNVVKGTIIKGQKK